MKPTAVKKAKGTLRKSRSNPNEPSPAIWDGGDPPDGLNKQGKKEWERVVPQLLSMGVLGKIDYSMIFCYCNEYGKYLQFEEELSKTGRLIKAPSGYPIISPLESLSRQAFEKSKDLALQFGLTPVSRTKINASLPKSKTDESNAEQEYERLLKKVG